MLDESALEQRLVNLEHTVAELKRQMSAVPTTDNWLEKVTGSVSDEQTFLEILEYGKFLRHADKPVDETSEQE
ncbi:transferase hexapeptide repeat containing protein [Scytonema sp. NUACC26]|uniref:transferase hexapeptide repeat containing protein n=1 Tax=Scytonema sp. NUACC26 TaxID=3140176 RepID=UPI0034DBF530